jgi:hypothetical protein
VRKRDGSYYLSHVDEFVENLLKEDSLCQILTHFFFIKISLVVENI